MSLVKESFLFFDLLSSEESSSSDTGSNDEESNDRQASPKVENFVEIVDRYSELEFKENFRMNRRTFDHILNLISAKISTGGERGGQTINAKTQLLLTIWYFATPDSYRSICGRFDVGKATGLRCVRRVTKALLSLSSSIIRWPEGNVLQETQNKFEQMGFPSTIGCIDGTYIPIPLPKDNGLAYICRKNFACVILQAVCNSELLFLHCYAGEVGAVHDAKVLKRSEVWNFMTTREQEMFPNNTHLLGDKAYPCIPQLMTPYKDNGHLTRQQRHFNYIHARVRSTIERAFALLKKRFRILKFMDVRKIEWIPPYIIACCILHNICILQQDLLGMDVNDNPEDALEERAEENIERQLQQRCRTKRDLLCAELN